MAKGDWYKCKDCGHEWKTRKSRGEPPSCPRCSSKDIFNQRKRRKEREKKKRRKEREKKKRKRRSKKFRKKIDSEIDNLKDSDRMKRVAKIIKKYGYPYTKVSEKKFKEIVNKISELSKYQSYIEELDDERFNKLVKNLASKNSPNYIIKGLKIRKEIKNLQNFSEKSKELENVIEALEAGGKGNNYIISNVSKFKNEIEGIDPQNFDMVLKLLKNGYELDESLFEFVSKIEENNGQRIKKVLNAYMESEKNRKLDSVKDILKYEDKIRKFEGDEFKKLLEIIKGGKDLPKIRQTSHILNFKSSNFNENLSIQNSQISLSLIMVFWGIALISLVNGNNLFSSIFLFLLLIVVLVDILRIREWFSAKSKIGLIILNGIFLPIMPPIYAFYVLYYERFKWND